MHCDYKQELSGKNDGGQCFDDNNNKKEGRFDDNNDIIDICIICSWLPCSAFLRLIICVLSPP